jgi:hypothetical protein
VGHRDRQALEDPGECRRQQRRQVAHPQTARRVIPRLVYRPTRGVRLLQQAPCLSEQEGAGVGQRDASRIAVEEPHAELVLELAAR